MATNYPASLDTTSNLPTSPDPFVEDVTTGHLNHSPTMHGAILALEGKLGIGSSTAASASTGQVIAKNSNGTTTWQTITAAATITTQDEGSNLSTAVTTVNFTGAGVTASGAGATTTVNIPGGAPLPGINSQSGTAYTFVLSDADNVVELTSASSVTLTVPPNSSVAFPIGSSLEATRMGTGSVTIVAGSGVTIRTPGTLVFRTQYSTVMLRKRATDEWVLAGDTT